MHLLLATRGSIAENGEAIDLGQTPADVIVLTAADTEIVCLAAAYRSQSHTISLRIANIMRLAHPMSVDAYIERTAQFARVIVVRCLGGEGYWPYGLQALHALALERNIALVVLPGDDKPDPSLQRLCTVAPDVSMALWACLVEGGEANAGLFLDHCSALVRGENPSDDIAAPLPKSGLWNCNLDNLKDELRPKAAILFYRALVQSGQTAAIAALCDALKSEGVTPVPIYVPSLRDAVAAATLEHVFGAVPPDVIINATAFSVSAPGAERVATALDATRAPVLQVALAGTSREAWAQSAQGLSSKDLIMNVALPEVDGRIFTRAISFKAAATFDDAVECDILTHHPDVERCVFVAKLAANWARLRRTLHAEKHVAILLANYPNKDGRLANGVGLDTPAGTVEVLKALAGQGYDVGAAPTSGDALMDVIRAGVTNAVHINRVVSQRLMLSHYKTFFETLPVQIQDEVTARWGAPEADPFFVDGAFALPLTRFGNVMIGIQPARGYNINPTESYHSPDLVPPHNYLATYAFLRREFGAHAFVHMGKHGNLEWLPGKSLALSPSCYPEAVLGLVPHIYPFIVNDPGEGTQAKRRSAAVIIDHLTPPLTRAESHGPMRDLEALVDEYYQAAGSDPRRLKILSRQIAELMQVSGLDFDIGLSGVEAESDKLERLDAHLCDLKELQIRDGLHVFGVAPEGRLLTDLVVALARVPRGAGEGKDNSLQRAIAGDVFGESNPSLSAKPTSLPQGERLARVLESAATNEEIKRVTGSISPLAGEMSPEVTERGSFFFDPLNTNSANPWHGPKPTILADLSPEPWRINGDAVERIELLAAKLVSGDIPCPENWRATQMVLEEIETRLKPSVIACGPTEISGILTALNGEFVAPGPSGAPTRGRPDVLPTGRNFYSVDTRAIPTETAWELGKKSAEALIARHAQEHGDWPKSIGLTAWGTANMRTGGDDIAQALALIGVKPVWDGPSRRVTGYEIISVAQLGRPRVDVTLRISGFFRDAFPDQIALFDQAVRAVGALDELVDDNPIAAKMRAEQAALIAQGTIATEAIARAGYRVFGSKPGAYGAGLQALIDEGGWEDRADLGEAYLVWGSYAYGANADGKLARADFETRLSGIEAIVQNQDNREHDLLDSDDYYQFEGGMAAAAEKLTGARPILYHNDHSRPERPIIRTLEEEIARVVRGRCANPKWIAGVMRHGYKGAFEMAATVDYLFAFSATTGAVRDHHFQQVFDAYLTDEAVRQFIADKNPDALREMALRFEEAIKRGLWTPKSNSAQFLIADIADQTQGNNGYGLLQ
jgi:cobaltochelatase CobN